MSVDIQTFKKKQFSKAITVSAAIKNYSSRISGAIPIEENPPS